MTIQEAQRELRRAYLGGSVGQLVSGALWLTAAAVSTWYRPSTGMLVLLGGGVLIFPVTVLLLRLMGRSTRLSPDNPFNQLATQIALTVPLAMVLAILAQQHHAAWFYPAMMIIVGAHYLPFVFLYGLRHFAVLCGAMVGGGILLVMYGRSHVTIGAWATGALLVAFAAVLWVTATAEERRGA